MKRSKHFVVLLKLYINSSIYLIKLHKIYLYIVAFIFVFKSFGTLFQCRQDFRDIYQRFGVLIFFNINKKGDLFAPFRQCSGGRKF